MRLTKTSACLSLTAAGFLAAALASTVLANDELTALAADSKNWAMPTGDYANHRYSELNQITKDNVKDLQVKWTFSTGVLRGHEGGPLVIGDVMYVHTPFPNIVYALDLKNDGKILWKYEPRQDPNVIGIMCCDTVNRGVAYGDGKIILNQADTTVVALDAKTGEDITHQVLTQIIVDEESRGATMLPVNFLRQLIGLYGGQMQGAVPQYLEAAMEAFQKNSATVAGAFGPNMFTDLAKRNMAMFEEAAQSLTGKKAKAESDGSGDELAKLKAELAALQAKVDKLGK